MHARRPRRRVRHPIVRVIAAASAAAILAPVLAAATPRRNVTVGGRPGVPACPPKLPVGQCALVLGRASAFTTTDNGQRDVTTVTQPGVLSAGLLGVSALTPDRVTRARDVQYLNRVYGGAPSAVVTVLSPVGAGRNRQWVVMAQSRRFNLSASLGRVARLPFTPQLAVLPGDVVALTTPTWAPVLRIGLSANRFAYRQSRPGRCAHAPTGAFAPFAFGGSSAYACAYAGTTVELAATEQLTSGAATPCRGPFTLPAVEGPAAIVFDAVHVTAAAGIGCSAALHVAAKAWAERGLRYVFGAQFAPGAYGGPFRAGGFDCYLTAQSAAMRAGECSQHGIGIRFVDQRTFWQQPHPGYAPPALTPPARVSSG